MTFPTRPLCTGTTVFPILFSFLQAATRPVAVVVTGKVTINGDIVRGGTIVFHCEADGRSYRGTIQADGSYRVEGVVPGRAVITLTNADPSEPGQIPDRYCYWDPQYGLAVMIDASGKSSVTRNFNLKP
jgi:hypothetical protein